VNEISVHRCVPFALRARECLEVLCTIRWGPLQQEKVIDLCNSQMKVAPYRVRLVWRQRGMGRGHP
jgi:hypothetical protein